MKMNVMRVIVLAALVPVFGGALCGNTRTKSDAEKQHELACVEYQLENDLGRAEVACDLCLEYAKGRNPECLNSLGLVHLQRGENDKARTYFKTAIREFNDFAQARNNMGYMEFQEGRFNQAISFFKQSIEIDPRYQDGRYNLALSYLRLGQNAYADQKDPTANFKKSEVQYRRLFELFPDDLRPYHDTSHTFILPAHDMTKPSIIMCSVSRPTKTTRSVAQKCPPLIKAHKCVQSRSKNTSSSSRKTLDTPPDTTVFASHFSKKD